jgi:hypothetical protein
MVETSTPKSVFFVRRYSLFTLYHVYETESVGFVAARLLLCQSI